MFLLLAHDLTVSGSGLLEARVSNANFLVTYAFNFNIRLISNLRYTFSNILNHLTHYIEVVTLAQHKHVDIT